MDRRDGPQWDVERVWRRWYVPADGAPGAGKGHAGRHGEDPSRFFCGMQRNPPLMLLTPRPYSSCPHLHLVFGDGRLEAVVGVNVCVPAGGTIVGIHVPFAEGLVWPSTDHAHPAGKVRGRSTDSHIVTLERAGGVEGFDFQLTGSFGPELSGSVHLGGEPASLPSARLLYEWDWRHRGARHQGAVRLGLASPVAG